MAEQYSLHQCALDAEHALERLATELGKAGADSQAVEAVSKMALTARKLVAALGPDGAAAQAQGQPPDQPAQAQAAPAPAPPQAPRPPRPTIQSAAQDLRSQAQSQAAGRPKRRMPTPRY